MVEPKARERAEEKEATTTTHERDIAGGSITDDVRTLPVRGLQSRNVRNEDEKTSLESFTFLPVFGFGNESEDGTDIYIILTYFRMLSIGY